MSTQPDQVATRLCKRLEYQFAQPGLLEMALTHRSAGRNHNERLEFLGDAVLSCVIASELYKVEPPLPEGDLSRTRASLVRESTLAEVATELELGDCIRLGPGESGSQRRASVLADTLEAVLGAIYLDGGFEQARSVILHCFAGRLANLPDPESLKDAKTRLQEYLQARSMSLPEYRLEDESGPPHKRRFVVSCLVTDHQSSATGRGSSRRKAEQAAAAAVLEKLRHE